MDNASSSFEEAWSRFLRLNRLRPAGDTLESEWTKGRTEYLAFLVRITDPQARRYISRLTERIKSIRGVEPYPPAYWHITVKGVGFEVAQPKQADELSPQAVEQLAWRASEAFSTFPAYEARLGPIGGFETVAFVEVHDGGHSAELNSRLLQIGSTAVQRPFDTPNYLPHVSIAGYTADVDVPALKDVLASLRSEGPGPTILVREVLLIRAHLNERAPSFDVIASYQLRS
jgi:2'-5' RNA ligase